MEYSIFQNFQYVGYFFFFFFGIFYGIFHILKFSISRMFCYFFVIFEINIPKNIFIYNLKSNFGIFLKYSIFQKFWYFTCLWFFVEYSISKIFIFHGIVQGIFRGIFYEIFQFKNRVCYAGAWSLPMITTGIHLKINFNHTKPVIMSRLQSIMIFKTCVWFLAGSGRLSG